MTDLRATHFWQRADAEKRRALTELVSALYHSPLAMKCVYKLAERKPLYQRENPFEAKSLDGRTLTFWLLFLVRGKLSSALAKQRSALELCEDILEALVLDGDVSQGDFNACAAASLESCIRRTKPTEFARAVILLATSGDYEPIVGCALSLPDSALIVDHGDVRPWPSRLFQSAVMQFDQTGVYERTLSTQQDGGGRDYYALSPFQLLPSWLRPWLILLTLPFAALIASFRLRAVKGQSINTTARLFSALTGVSVNRLTFVDAPQCQTWLRKVAQRNDFDPAKVMVRVPPDDPSDPGHALSLFGFDPQDASKLQLLNSWRSQSHGQTIASISGLRRTEHEQADIWTYDLLHISPERPLYVIAPIHWAS